MVDHDQRPAVTFAREFIQRFNDPDWVARDLGTVLAPGFVREDHRRAADERIADRGEWISQQSLMTEVAEQWPTYTYDDTIEVRGSRLVAFRTSVALGEGDELAFVMVLQCDQAGEQAEFASFHDAGEVDAVSAELDRLHARLTDRSAGASPGRAERGT